MKLQADFIKLDGSIIQGINKSKTAKAVVDFVSTKERYIDYFQGYLFDEPKNVKDLKIGKDYLNGNK